MAIQKSMQAPRARFVGGTIVLDNVNQEARPPEPFQWHEGKWRSPAFHYRAVRSWLRKEHIRDTIPRWQKIPLRLSDNRRPHPYQTLALNAWLKSDRWGSVVLPTGAGKTFLALKAMSRTGVSTLIVVPTIDLLHQWYACLENAFGESAGPVGVWYGLEKEAHPLTVTTYHSAWADAETLGNQFKLLIFDEIHHLPAPSWHEIALMCAGPYRLGLTATYPDYAGVSGRSGGIRERQRRYGSITDSSALLDEIVGPVTYRKSIDDLTGKQLAEYRTQRIRIDLREEERTAYDAAYAVYTGYLNKARLRGQYGPAWWDEFTRRSAFDAEARRAKVAELKLKEIVHQARAKLDILDQLLREHCTRQMLVFTAHNRFAYRISGRHLIPVITHQTKAAERKAVLDNFRAGSYRAIVTSRVLNEGIDVPEAKIAVVLGGTAGAREYIQRLGRVLRKQGNTEAVLYEVIVRKTVDESIARRRRGKG
ncbi:DEAD/DEAH box helicase family protein [Desulfobacterales bacterium HSG2]|nr:DEAD/DEAH box helicase family protein [Desulfobacterales bacterium HSG2]